MCSEFLVLEDAECFSRREDASVLLGAQTICAAMLREAFRLKVKDGSA
jgi:hypothetical protein